MLFFINKVSFLCPLFEFFPAYVLRHSETANKMWSSVSGTKSFGLSFSQSFLFAEWPALTRRMAALTCRMARSYLKDLTLWRLTVEIFRSWHLIIKSQATRRLTVSRKNEFFQESGLRVRHVQTGSESMKSVNNHFLPTFRHQCRALHNSNTLGSIFRLNILI